MTSLELGKSLVLLLGGFHKRLLLRRYLVLFGLGYILPYLVDTLDKDLYLALWFSFCVQYLNRG